MSSIAVKENKEKDIVEALKKWVSDRNEGVAADEVGIGTDLIDTGLLDSLQFVSFMLLIEELRGNALKESEVDLGNFRTIETILKVLF